MTTRLARPFAGLLCLVLVLALVVPVAAGAGADRAQESPSPQAQWLSFDGNPTPTAPALSILKADGDAIDLQAGFAGALTEDVKAEGQAYTRIFGEGYGFASQVGLPNLPVLRREVEIPFAAEVAVEFVAVEYQDHTLAELGLHPIYPVQPPLPKTPGSQQPFQIDRAFYASGGLYPAGPLNLAESYIVRGHRVLPVEVWPVAYNPSAGMVRLYRSVTFRLKLSGSDLALTRQMADRYASPAFEPRLSQQILNYNQGRPAVRFSPDSLIGYLIVTADAYHEAMLPFVSLKQSRGFEVTMTNKSEIPGGTASDIKAYIQTAYDTWPLPPSYVLLVGDTDTMPTFTGPVIGTSTDLYFGTMDGQNDWHPDIGRGRFPVRSAGQTTWMVDKYLAYSGLTGQEPWVKKASFPATCDNYPVAEGTHNYVIDSYTLPNGYTGIFPNNPQPGGDKLYCVTYSATHADLIEAFNDGRWAIIYSGHGSYNGWEMDFVPSDIDYLTSYGTFPFVASHACLTGDFGITETFGETWVLQENKGALVFWGSSTYSYWGEDDVLERRMFDSLFAPGIPHADVAQMTDAGLAGVEAAYPSSARYYWETYNVLGDPGVKIFLEPDTPTFTLDVEPTDHELCGSGSVDSTVTIGSVLGYTGTVYLSTQPLPPGISASFIPPSAPAPFTAQLTLSVAPDTPPGDYDIVVEATDNTITLDAVVHLRVVQSPPDPPLLLNPPDGAPDQPFVPTFEWEPLPLANSYHFLLDQSAGFESPIFDVDGIPANTFTPGTPLEGGLCYWWQVQASNACGISAWSAPFHFSTSNLAVGFYDDVESGSDQWSHQATQGTDHWAISTDQSHSPTHSWFVPDDAVVTDTRLWNTVAVPVDGGSTLTFWHRYQFEGSSYDGSVLELSTDGGATWSDLGPYITANGYNGTISSGYSNPLAGRQGWVGDLNDWTEVTVDLSSFAEQSAKIRWRLGCDSSVSDVGWYIDDVQVTSPLPPNPPPTLDSIAPDSGSPAQPTPVQISGSGFLGSPSLHLGTTWLADVALVSPSLIEAVVPAGMAPGIYDLVLYNGDCQQATLPGAFTVIGEDTIHVSGVKLKYDDLGGRYRVISSVRILDQNNQFVNEATVSVEWTLPSGATLDQQAVTNARSIASFRVRSIQTGMYRICVSDVVKVGYSYDPDQNVETCDTITVP